MMMLTSVLVLALVQAPPSTVPKPSAPVVQVGVFSYGPDGNPQGAAYDTTLETETFQYVGGCVIGGGNRPVPDRATDAWKLSGKVQSLNADEAVVRVDWQRIRAGGAAVTSPGGSVQLTLHVGDRVPLDSANPEPGAGCGGRTIEFEARFGPRPAWMVGPGGALSSSPSVTVMHTGGGVGIGAGAGAGAGEVGPGRGGAGRVTSSARADAADATDGRTYSADLWLVRPDKSQPDKPDFNMQGLILQVVGGAADYAFSPFSIDTARGPLSVQITGSLRVTTQDGSPQLIVSTARTVRYASSNTSGESTSISKGTSTTKNPMPGPADVLSFELPPIRVPNGTATLPDQFEVRVRIR